MIPIQYSYTLITVLTVDLLATSGDITLSWTSPTYPKLYSNNTSINPIEKPISEYEDSLIGSLLTIGAVIGPFPFGFIAGKFGRRPALLLLAIPHVFSYLTLAFSKSIYLFYIGRILGGVAMGGGYAILPMYIAEISKNSNRGRMSQSMNVFWSVGSFLPYGVGPFLSIMYFNLFLSTIPAVFFILFYFIGPETPYYLVQRNKAEEARDSLMLLRSANEKEVQAELDKIQESISAEEKGNFTELFKRKELRKAFVICIVLIIAQEISGFCAIMFYLQPIFEATGTGIPSEISAIAVGIAMLVSSFFTPCFIETSGRRKLTIYSCCGMFVSLALLGAFFYIQDSSQMDTSSIFWMPIFSLILYIFSYNLGIGPIPWTLCSELFPTNFKQSASSSVSVVCWTTSFLVTKFFNDMNNGMGTAGTFWFFSGMCFLATIFSVVWVPETKGKSFTEIQNMLRGVAESNLQDT